MLTISAWKPLSRNRCRITTELPPSPYVPITSGSTRPIRTVESAIFPRVVPYPAGVGPSLQPPGTTAASSQGAIQLQERGVVRDDLDMARRARRDRLDGVVHQRVLDARVAEPHRKVGTA